MTQTNLVARSPYGERTTSVFVEADKASEDTSPQLQLQMLRKGIVLVKELTEAAAEC